MSYKRLLIHRCDIFHLQTPEELLKTHIVSLHIPSWATVLKSYSQELMFGDSKDPAKVFKVPLLAGDTPDIVRQKLMNYAYTSEFRLKWRIYIKGEKVYWETRVPTKETGNEWWTYNSTGSLQERLPHFVIEQVGMDLNGLPYGVPLVKKHTYNDKADQTDVPCYFTKSLRAGMFISQQQPNAVVSDTIDIHFLRGTDVRMNDRVVYEGVAYRIKTAKLIRNHHIEAEAERIESL